MYCLYSKKIKHWDLQDWDGTSDPVVMAIMRSIQRKCQKSSLYYITFFVVIFQLTLGITYLFKTHFIRENTPEETSDFNPRLYLEGNLPSLIDVWSDHVTNQTMEGNSTILLSALKRSLNPYGFKTQVVLNNNMTVQDKNPSCPLISPHLRKYIYVCKLSLLNDHPLHALIVSQSYKRY